MTFLSYGHQSISEADIATVASVLRSDFLTGGSKVEEFEARFADRVGARYAVAVNNATAALHLALRAAEIGRGDRVITSPNTFLASANCAAYVGAIPDFADIDQISYNIDPDSVAATWRADVKAIVTVDYAGQTADLPSLARLARERGAILIEDACHAVGGRFNCDGKLYPIGGHPWADMTVFSFHPVKAMTTGEGGMLVTNNHRFAERARILRSHGIVRNADAFVGLGGDGHSFLSERGPWYHEMVDLGYNYRLTDFQCALGISQMDSLERFIARRRTIVAAYNEAFCRLEWFGCPQLRNPADRNHNSWHLYTAQIDFARLGKSRSEVMSELRAAGVGSQVLYIPVYLQPWYRRTYGYAPGKCPRAESFYARALSLPLYPAMTDSQVQRVVAAVRALGRK